MKKKLAEKICKHWNENFCGVTAATKTRAVLYKARKEYDVEIFPVGENVGEAFHHIEELFVVSKAYGLSCYVMVLEGKLIARMF